MLQKFGFEVGKNGTEFFRGFDGAKIFCGGEDGFHLFEIVRVVGAEVNDAAGLQDTLGDFCEAFVDETVFEMLSLGPGVGKINVQGGRGFGGYEIFQKISRLDAHAAEVREAGAAAFAVELADASAEAFDTDEVALGMGGGVVEEEGGVAAAEFDFEGLVFWKIFRDVQRFED